jgi:signal transduction histidine kinase/PAS domain-containing protein
MLPLEYSPAVFPLLFAAFLAALVTFYAWPRRHVDGAVPLGLIAAVVVFWCSGYAFEMMADTLANKVLAGKIQYIGITLSPYFWLWFSLAYTQQRENRLWSALPWLALMPTTTMLLVWTNEWHGLIWAETTILQSEGFTLLGVTYGPWFWVHFTVSYLFLLVGTIIVLRGLWHMRRLYRSQVTALLISVLSPWLGNILYFTNLSPIPDLDLTPFAFTISVIAMAWGIFGSRLIDIAPIARDLVVERMREGVLIVNTKGRVTDINPAAAQAIGLPTSQAIGKLVQDVLAPWPHLFSYLQAETETEDEIVIGQGEVKVRYGVRIAPLYDQQQRPLGHIITTLAGGHKGSLLTDDREPIQQTPELSTAETDFALFPQVPANTLLQTIIKFLIPSIREDVDIMVGESSNLNQLFEQAFTAMLRFALVFSIFAILWAVPYTLINPSFIGVLIPFSAGVAIVAVLSLARSIKFVYRVRVFLIALYVCAFIEVVNYGYSVEAFTFFLTLSALGILLQGWRTGLIIVFINLATLLIFGWQISQGHYHPLAIPPGQPATPDTFYFVILALAIYSVNIAMVTVLTAFLLRSVDKAWQRATQAKNLLQQERDALERRVRDRTRQLALARDQAVEASQYKSLLLTKVSHELRTPLGGILGYAELLNDGVMGGLQPKQSQFVEQIIQSSHHLGGLISDLLDQSYIEQGKLNITEKPFRLADMIHFLEGLLYPVTAEKGLEFTLNCAAGMPEVIIGDERRLHQIVLNLANNAVKFTTAGSVKIDIAPAAANGWQIQVHDTGLGMKPDIQTKIFDPFWQADSSTSSPHKGYGLGLSVVHNLVHLMNGRIDVESRAGEGSVFTVWLPLKIPELSINEVSHE